MKDDWGAPDAAKLAKRAKELAEDGKIDEISGLADNKIYLFSGNEDQTVVRSVVEAAKRFYEAAGVPEGSVTLVEKEGGHSFLTETEGTACGLSKDPYVSDCDYDQAKAILEWIYGSPLADASPSPTGKFITFDQSPFSTGMPTGLAAEGVVYVPQDCVDHPGCRLHIALHGCDQARETVGDAFIEKTGFAHYADSSRLVFLFPQIAASVVNPHGCWDWWGYSDIDYLSKDAPQIKAVWASRAPGDAALRERPPLEVPSGLYQLAKRLSLGRLMRYFALWARYLLRRRQSALFGTPCRRRKRSIGRSPDKPG